MEQQRIEEETRRAVCAAVKDFNKSQVNSSCWFLFLLMSGGGEKMKGKLDEQ